MKFHVTIDDKVWTKTMKRLAGQSHTGEDADVLETLIVQGLTEDRPAKPAGELSLSSTTIMLTFGKVKVVKLTDE